MLDDSDSKLIAASPLLTNTVPGQIPLSMREVLSIGVSHRSNHVLTQFFNGQEQLLHDAEAQNEPAVFLAPNVDRISKTVSYKPRALLWDSRTGNGSLGMHQYDSADDFYFAPDREAQPPSAESGLQFMQTHDPIPKSEYQSALDANLPLPPLDDSNTTYWSDYSKLIFGSSNLNTLRDWYHNTAHPSAPDFQNLHQTYFDQYDVGYKEFSSKYRSDFFDEKLRAQLESCDGLQGINLLTELENGWGGFSSCLLEDLRDDLPKTDILTWGFQHDDVLTLNQPVHSTKTKFKMICNKIRSSLNLIRESSLFLPIFSDPQLSAWRFAGRTCLLFDAVNSAVSNRSPESRSSFSHIVGALTLGESQRNVVSNLTAQDLDFSFYSRVPRYKTTLGSKVFTHLSISRDPELLDPDNNCIKTYPWQPSDTIPNDYSSITNYTARLEVTEKPRDVFKSWSDLVSRHFRYDTDREELKDELGTLASAYEEGWYDDDDSGDDL